MKFNEAEERMRRGDKQPTKVDVEVGRLIRQRRIDIGLTQAALANSVGICFQQLQKYESGKNRVGAGRLQSIASTLGVPITYFFSGDQNLLRAPGAVDLLNAYARLEDPAIRSAVVRLVQSLANADSNQQDVPGDPQTLIPTVARHASNG